MYKTLLEIASAELNGKEGGGGWVGGLHVSYPNMWHYGQELLSSPEVKPQVKGKIKASLTPP